MDTNVIKDKKLFIFDMDGTIYLGGIPFDFAIEFIKNLRKNGKKVLFFTNNASHTSPFYLQKLTRLGYEPTAEIMKRAITVCGRLGIPSIVIHASRIIGASDDEFYEKNRDFYR